MLPIIASPVASKRTAKTDEITEVAQRRAALSGRNRDSSAAVDEAKILAELREQQLTTVEESTEQETLDEVHHEDVKGDCQRLSQSPLREPGRREEQTKAGETQTCGRTSSKRKSRKKKSK